MRTYAAFVIVAMVCSHVCAAETKTPEILVGRWTLVKSLTQGELQSTDGLQVEVEFTSSQMHMRMYLRSQERPQMPTYIADCYFTSKDGLLMLDMKTAENNPGPETGIHNRDIYKIDGDTLWICSGHTDDPKTAGERPTEFVSSREGKSDLYVLNRIKPN